MKNNAAPLSWTPAPHLSPSGSDCCNTASEKKYAAPLKEGTCRANARNELESGWNIDSASQLRRLDRRLRARDCAVQSVYRGAEAAVDTGATHLKCSSALGMRANGIAFFDEASTVSTTSPLSEQNLFASR